VIYERGTFPLTEAVNALDHRVWIREVDDEGCEWISAGDLVQITFDSGVNVITINEEMCGVINLNRDFIVEFIDHGEQW